ncbi:hypothetical protein CSKR_202597 [Clonorchis sinensis]|uniref:Uncharacterized protein n=1 Tax=Clonorchis sinensis TaxID=79923 RepID=A0A8T1M1N4_CLOSI|nr:hypothetical protein CSKR_202597 [Clonorchis sinensis]
MDERTEKDCPQVKDTDSKEHGQLLDQMKGEHQQKEFCSLEAKVSMKTFRSSHGKKSKVCFRVTDRQTVCDSEQATNVGHPGQPNTVSCERSCALTDTAGLRVTHPKAH